MNATPASVLYRATYDSTDDCRRTSLTYSTDGGATWLRGPMGALDPWRLLAAQLGPVEFVDADAGGDAGEDWTAGDCW